VSRKFYIKQLFIPVAVSVVIKAGGAIKKIKQDIVVSAGLFDAMCAQRKNKNGWHTSVLPAVYIKRVKTRYRSSKCR
jgi:hypothetical protein